jgi:O-antigen ligase
MVAAVSAANGGYFPTSWGWIAVGLGWLVCALAVSGTRALTRREWAFVLAWALVAGWIFLSILWARDGSGAYDEGFRALILPLAGAAVLLAVRARDVAIGALLLAVGVTAVAAYALATRLLPDRVGSYDPVAGTRLAAPLGYWNALGILCVIGILLALAAAVRGGALARVAAAFCITVLLPTLYFTFSRGAWISLGVGLIVGLALDERRLASLVTTAALFVAPAAAVALAMHTTELTHVGVPLSRAANAGHHLAIELVAVVVGGAGLAAATALIGPRVAPSARTTHMANVAFLLIAVAAIVSVVAVVGGPRALVDRTRHAFSAASPDTHGDLNNHLFNFSGSGRATLWRAALSDARNHPLAGAGAGSFEQYWLAHRTQVGKVRDAHSLYVETLSELGGIGLALLAAALAMPLLALRRARRSAAVPLIAGAYVAFIVHAGVDWDWEMPAIMILGLFSGGLLLAAARSEDDEWRALRGLPRTALAVGTIVIIAVAFVGLVGNLFLARGTTAASEARWTTATRDAQRAASWLPWSSQPWRQRGEAELAQGRTAAAQVSFRNAIRKDSSDWSLWLDLARASSGEVQRRALARATMLDPLSPEIAAFRSDLGAQNGISIVAGAKP